MTRIDTESRGVGVQLRLRPLVHFLKRREPAYEDDSDSSLRADVSGPDRLKCDSYWQQAHARISDSSSTTRRNGCQVRDGVLALKCRPLRGSVSGGAVSALPLRWAGTLERRLHSLPSFAVASHWSVVRLTQQ
jgi:hypothetical protein